MQPRVVRLQGSSNPFVGALVMLLALILGLAALIILLPIAIIAGLVAAAYITIRRALARVGTPNSRVAGVRTDGRDNVRVITRDPGQSR